MKFLIIDNYDSFVYNIAQYLGELGVESDVIRNDKITISQIKENNYENLVKWIENPDSIKIGTRMKNHASIYNSDKKLTDQEIQQIAKYLLSLKPDNDSMASYNQE